MTTPNVETSMVKSMPISESEKVLGVGKDYGIHHVLQCFDVVQWTRKENDEVSDLTDILLAKNSLLRHLVCLQKKKYRFFTIKSPFANTCPKCSGAGEIYKFFEKVVDVNCHICGKKGTLKDDCPVCKGTGRFVKRWKGGGGVNLECSKCNGTKKVEIKCVKCKGEGILKKPVLTHDLKSTTPCKKCNQLGFLVESLPPKKKKKKFHKKKAVKKTPFAPIMDQSLAEKIKAGLADS